MVNGSTINYSLDNATSVNGSIGYVSSPFFDGTTAIHFNGDKDYDASTGSLADLGYGTYSVSTKTDFSRSGSGADSWTYMGWVQVNDLTPNVNSGFFGRAYKWAIACGNTGNITTAWRSNNGDIDSYTIATLSGSDYELGSPFHLAARFDGTKNLATYFLNGSKVADQLIAGSIDSENDLYIGDRAVQGGNVSSNSKYIGCVRVWDDVLSDQEIGSEMNSFYPVRTGSLVWSVLGDEQTNGSDTYFLGEGVSDEFPSSWSMYGGSRYIRLPGTNSDFNITGSEVTLAAWVYPETLSGRDEVIKKSSNYWMNLQNTGSINTFHDGVSPSAGYYESDEAVGSNVWSRIVSVYNGSSIRQYINGSLVGNHTGLSGSLTATNSDIFIGYHSSTAFLNGRVCGVFVGSTAWSDEEVEYDYNNGRGLKYPPVYYF